MGASWQKNLEKKGSKYAQPSTTLAIYTQVYDKRRKEIRNQMSKELYEWAKKKHEGRNLRAFLVEHSPQHSNPTPLHGRWFWNRP